MSNNPVTRMAAFDSMRVDDRELANEYGVNVVRLYRGLGADDLQIRACCERHRLAKQMETLVPISFKKEARAATRRQLQADLADILATRSLEAEAIDRRVKAKAAVVATDVINAVDLHETKPRRSWLSRMLGR